MTLHQYPSISIIIPSYNQGAFIERTLLSILKQDYNGRVEIIVSDGGSKDETVEILKKYDKDIIWWSAPDNGFVDAVMKGLNKATGDIVAIQSSDDFYLKDSFKHAMLTLQLNPESGFVCGGEVSIDLDNEIIRSDLGSGSITPYSILFKRIPPQHGTFVRRKLINEVGGLRSEVDMCADIDLWYRISHLKEGLYIKNYIGVYQQQPNQRTKNSDQWCSSLIKMVETVEKDSSYSTRFKLSDKQKLSLYKYWEILWAGLVGNHKDAEAAALQAKENIHEYDERTRNIINSYSNDDSDNNPQIGVFAKIYRQIRWRVKTFFKAKPQKAETESFTISASDLLWWKE